MPIRANRLAVPKIKYHKLNSNTLIQQKAIYIKESDQRKTK